MGIVIFMFIFSAVMYPWKFSQSDPSGCRVGDAVVPEKEPVVLLPPIKNAGQPREGFDGGWDTGSPPVEYVLLRRNVPIFVTSNDPNYLMGYPDYMGRDNAVSPPQIIKWPIIADTDFLGVHADTRHTLKYPEANQPGFDVYYANSTGEVELPAVIQDRTGASTKILTLRTEGFLIFVHLGEDNKPVKVNYGQHIYYMVDFYQDKKLYQTPKSVKGYEVDDMFHCLDPDAPFNPEFYNPDQKRSGGKDQMQLEWFVIKGAPGMYSHCKPAVYLYPQEKQLVNVKVFPKGELTYTKPVYDPDSGWTVESYPGGAISNLSDFESYPYLYYESRLRDSEIKKPESGWVVAAKDLTALFKQILPKLGLNAKEEADFIGYWQNALPPAEYYFVGLVDRDQRDYLEPLVVTPPPDTSIRFSLYFEKMDKPKQVEEPLIITPERRGFTLVDWGGMIKNDSDHAYTCSQ